MGLFRDLFGKDKTMSIGAAYAKNMCDYWEYDYRLKCLKYLLNSEEYYIKSLKYVLNYNACSSYFDDKVEKEIEEVRKNHKTYLALFTAGYTDEAKKVEDKTLSLVKTLVIASSFSLTPTEYEAKKAKQIEEAKEYLESVGYKLDKIK